MILTNPTTLISAFLQNDDVNVIVLDWSRLANRGYTTAKRGTSEVGRGLGRFVNWLAELGLSYERVHLVGFSLGGHLVGNAGRETGSRVKRITGNYFSAHKIVIYLIHDRKYTN